MNSPPDYQALIEKYNLILLKGGGDLQLESSGDLKRSRRGDLQLGDSYFHALFQFVNAWIVNEPTIKVLFASVQSSLKVQADLEENRNSLANNVASQMHRGENPTNTIQAVSLQLGAISIGRGAYAGAIMVVINAMLQGLRSDLKAKEFWNSTQPLQQGYSFGRIIEAASNNFRHYDEWQVQWAQNKSFTEQQNKSVDVIANVLNLPSNQKLAANVCGELLLEIAGSEFERLESCTVQFAHSLAETCKTSGTLANLRS